MKFLIALAMFVACASAASVSFSVSEEEWTAYKTLHGKAYEAAEEIARRAIWAKNVAKVAQHNADHAAGKRSYTLKMNVFGDWSHEEFLAKMVGVKQSNKANGASAFLAPANYKAPDSVDWRTKGYVTPVKDQGQCGSCWAFSAVASLEGQHFAKTGKLVSLAEQELVDCSGKFGNQGCNGGLMDQAYDYIKANKAKGIATEDSYPYTAQDGKCKTKGLTSGATVTGYTDIPSGDEDALTNAIATVGPIAVAIDASNDSFQLYDSGVYDEPNCSSTELDHGVTAVGYGSDNGVDFYIVKNSWAATWGMKGYINMSRNKDNQCGIATSASYPLV